MYSIRNIVPDRNLIKTFVYILYEVKIRINEYKTDFTAVFFTASFQTTIIICFYLEEREKKVFQKSVITSRRIFLYLSTL